MTSLAIYKARVAAPDLDESGIAATASGVAVQLITLPFLHLVSLLLDDQLFFSSPSSSGSK